jgi:Zn-dependent peptidase ImmA (M78 family)
MTTRREELLRATTEAATILTRFPVGTRTSFDIVKAVADLEIPLLFRPLGGLWGATITVGDDLGILVTTKLGLSVQRFTLAHELGHVLLGHETSFDATVGFAGRLASGSRPIQELAADTFASELLAPRPLMLAAAAAHRWTRASLLDPNNIYQLALRLGVSFQAACWALAAHGVIPEATARSLQDETVKELKLALAPKSLVENPWSDVWKITSSDSDKVIEAGPEDIFAVHLQDNASAGYLWQLVDAGPSAKILEEPPTHIDPNVQSYGALASREVFLRFTSSGVHRLLFEHRRPWNKQALAHIDVAIDNYGKEMGGFPRRLRERALATALPS